MIHSIRANLASTQLGRLSRFGIMRPSRERDLGARATTQFSIKHRGDIQPVAQLSGGNQQKVMLASRLLTKPRVLVIDEPSRGVDVAAREDIHRVLSEMARTGTAVVFTSSDIEECVALSDRLLVFRVGQVVAELTGAQKTEARALEAAGQDLEALAL
jgi:ABC-type sugar transport system ATPase subunit